MKLALKIIVTLLAIHLSLMYITKEIIPPTELGRLFEVIIGAIATWAIFMFEEINNQ